MKATIGWWSRITGKAGGGELAMSIESARESVRELNAQYPEIFHWVRVQP